MEIKERRRHIEEPHVRSIQLQTLDALLRIEELLSNPLVVIKAVDTPTAALSTAKPKARR